MVVTLSLSTIEMKKVLAKMDEYASLPTPSQYELERKQMGKNSVTFYTSGKVVVQGPNPDVERAASEKLVEWLGKEMDELVLGIDEVGRGEKDGPLVVSGVVGWRNSLRMLRDSKKTMDIKKKYADATGKSLMQVSVSFSAETIDALRNEGKTLNDLEASAAQHMHDLVKEFFPNALTIMDGRALKKGMKGMVFQEKADDSEASVSAASIVAKHLRNESGDHGERKTWKTKG
jgi:ribonuclease HII